MVRFRSNLLLVLVAVAATWLAISVLWRFLEFRAAAAVEAAGGPAPPRTEASEPREAPHAAPAPEDPSERVAAQAPGSADVRLDSEVTPFASLRLRVEPADGREPFALAIREALRFPRLSAGRYRVGLDEPAWTCTALELELGQGSDGREHRLAATCLGPWTACVRDALDGRPLESVHVRWSVRGELGDMGYRAEVGARELRLREGRFAIGCGGFVARASRLVLSAPGYAGFETPWIGWDGLQPVDLGEIALRPIGSLEPALAGRVVAAEDGSPLAGVRVFAFAADTPLEALWVFEGSLQGAAPLPDGLAVTDGDGAFHHGLRGLGWVRLAAFSPQRGLAWSDPVPCAPGAMLRMARRAVLEGQVLTTPELRDSGTLRSVSVETSERVAVVALDEDLRFELGGLPDGLARVALQVLEPASAVPARLAEALVRHVELHEGRPARIELRYGADGGARLRGRALLPGDVAPEGLRAALWPDGDPAPSSFAPLDAGGGFRFEDAPRRPFRVFVGGSTPAGERAFLAMARSEAAEGAGPSVELDLRAASVRGTAWKDGATLAGGLVVLHAIGGDPAWQRAVAEGLAPRTDADGAFAIHGLLPGRYEIGRAGGVRRSFEIAADVDAALVLDLQ